MPSAPNLAQFGQHAGGWASQDHYPRLLTDASADLNGDHRADIIGFGEHGVYTSLATGGGDFSNPSLALAQFAPAAGGWSSQDSYPRMTADVDGNGSGDIVGFGAAGVYV